jgi:hypothetical protein
MNAPNLSSAGFEPANFGSNDKHDKHYTTDGDIDQDVNVDLSKQQICNIP